MFWKDFASICVEKRNIKKNIQKFVRNDKKEGGIRRKLRQFDLKEGAKYIT